MSNEIYYAKLKEKYGDVRAEFLELIKKKDFDKMAKLWAKVRTEARFMCSAEELIKNYDYMLYCGTTFQDELRSICQQYLFKEEFEFLWTKIDKIEASPEILTVQYIYLKPKPKFEYSDD